MIGRSGALLAVTLAALGSACTTFDGLSAQPNRAADGGIIVDGPQPTNALCNGGPDCESGVCSANGTCAAPTSTDGVRNGTETDVDCGGGEPTNAPKCGEGKACRDAADCFWGHCTDGVCEGDRPGEQDGDQTDIDCGGTASPPCDWEKKCLEDRDCTSKACGPDKRCLTGPSCRAISGGSTCGLGELDDPNRQHESCCKSLPVPGFTDPRAEGKQVFLDKYEITAGRMRAFIEAVSAANGGVPNIKGYIEANRPGRWITGLEALLPTAMIEGIGTFTVSDPTADPLYPGHTDFLRYRKPGSDWRVISGTYTVPTGLVHALGAPHYFPEFHSPAPPWPSPDYAATHNLNCTNTAGAYGFSTYWFDKETIATHGGGVGKHFSQEQMDAKALNCTPTALFAAFCAWDGGQLATAEVFDYVAGGPWPADPAGSPLPAPPPRLAGANTQCGSPPNTLNTSQDSTNPCYGVYFLPDDGGNNYDGSSRIAPPGRVPADAVAINEGDEPWMDLKGNLLEVVFAPNGAFDYRGYGIGWGSSSHHKGQAVTGRMKSGSFGARCMRFK